MEKIRTIVFGSNPPGTDCHARSESETTALVVDDERDLADLYAAWLASTFDVRCAYDGAQALEMLDETVDAVLLDRHMPRMSGDDVLKELRTEYETPVAFVSGVTPDVDIVDLPFDEYLRKPVTEDDLYVAVDTLVARSTLPPDERERLAALTKIDLVTDGTPQADSHDHEAVLELVDTAGQSLPPDDPDTGAQATTSD